MSKYRSRKWHENNQVQKIRTHSNVTLDQMLEGLSVYTWQEFAAHATYGILKDEDGDGYLASQSELTALPAVPSQVSDSRMDLVAPELTHVVWMEK